MAAVTGGLAMGLPASAGAAAADLPYGGRFYGCLLQAERTGNSQIKRGRSVSVRFQAEESGTLRSFRWPLRCNRNSSEVGYSNGDGGQLVVELRRGLSSGLPDMSPAGRLAATPVNNNQAGTLVQNADNELWSFTAPAAVTAGGIYHLVFTQLHPTYWVSINAIFADVPGPTGQPGGRYGPYYGDAWTQLYQDQQGAWDDRARISWVCFHYTSGLVTGVGENFAARSTIRSFGGRNLIRQRFTPSTSFTADGVWFRVWAGGAGGGDLQIRIESGGSVLKALTVPRAGLPSGNSETTTMRWSRASLGGAVTLAARRTYDLVFAAPSGSYQSSAIRDGTSAGYTSRNRWQDSSAEFSTNGGSSWQGWSIGAWNPSRARRDMRLAAGFEAV